MNFQHNKLAKLSALLGLSFVTAAAIAVPATHSYKITDFRFGMEDPSFNTWETSQGATPIDPSQYGTLIEGTYQGTNKTNALVNFNFFNSEVHVSTNSSNEGNINTPANSVTGGPAPTIDLNALTADMSSWFAEWNGTDFNQGNNSNFTACTDVGPPDFSASPNAGLLSSVATVTDNFDGSYRINWNSCITGGSFNGQVGFWQLDVFCTTCPPTILGAADLLTASQNGGPNTNTVTVAGGNIVVTSGFGINPAGFTYIWKTSDGAIVDLDANSGTFTFNPSSLSPGNYVLTANFEDANTVPDPTRGSGEIVIRIIATASGDIADGNGNRIENKNDANLLQNQLQSELGSDKNTYVIESSAGSLRLGKTAFCANKASRITKEDINSFATGNCESAANTSDNQIKATGVGGYYDYEVTGISKGETVDIVIPLTTAIPKSAVYRKYTPINGWATFITADSNKLASAPAISDGVCPALTSDAYTPGLTKGDNCVKLSITDGGPNDADVSPNGLIKDPGGVAEINSGTQASIGSGCSIAGKPASLMNHSEWLILVTILAWFGIKSRFRQG